MDNRNAEQLYRDLVSTIRERPELTQFPTAQAKKAAKTLFRYGRGNFKAVIESDAPNRQHFAADVRKEKGFRSLSFIYDLFEVSPPEKGQEHQGCGIC